MDRSPPKAVSLLMNNQLSYCLSQQSNLLLETRIKCLLNGKEKSWYRKIISGKQQRNCPGEQRIKFEQKKIKVMVACNGLLCLLLLTL